ncbi:MAG TPA: gliding motility-associated C-terminal domain-containing protein, partial [Aequorivita sp.]|nr:gliding motility-associated C-terminal domain-containing protein [Aequorivita sp.]
INGKTSFTIPASQLSNIGQTTISINDLFIVGHPCGTFGSTIASVSFTIEAGSTPAIIPDGDRFCIADNPTIADLSLNIVDQNGTIVWYDAPINGTPYPTSTELLDGETYYGSTMSENECESEVRLTVTVSIVDCSFEVIIPDGFSPNGDGINDFFVIKKLRALYPNFSLEIFNRYGNVVYKGNANNPDWDGTSDFGVRMGSSELPVGVYFFILNFNKDDKKPYQGRVYLSR